VIGAFRCSEIYSVPNGFPCHVGKAVRLHPTLKLCYISIREGPRIKFVDGLPDRVHQHRNSLHLIEGVGILNSRIAAQGFNRIMQYGERCAGRRNDAPAEPWASARKRLYAHDRTAPNAFAMTACTASCPSSSTSPLTSAAACSSSTASCRSSSPACQRSARASARAIKTASGETVGCSRVMGARETLAFLVSNRV
jgi:hypothetical protein